MQPLRHSICLPVEKGCVTKQEMAHILDSLDYRIRAKRYWKEESLLLGVLRRMKSVVLADVYGLGNA